MIRPLIIAALVGLATAGPAAAAALNADRIATQAARVTGGRDAVAKLTFTLQPPGQSERKLVYDMAWKHYRDGDVRLKTIFFTDFPPDNRGEAYMGWFYRPAAHKEDDEWMYLPALRSLRKLGHIRSPDEKEHDEFSKSVLQDTELMPRDPGQDTHTLLRSEPLDGHDCFVVEYVPHKPAAGMQMDMGDMDMSDYSKTVHWIDSKTFVTRRIDYYAGGAAVKRLLIAWRQLGDAWVWDKVEGTDLKTHNRTTLQVSDLRIDLGLQDRVFSKRTMRLGLDAAVH